MHKPKYYILWVEGLHYFNGEKLKTLDYDDHTYTLKMTEAMRVKPQDVETVKDIMRELEFSNWCIDSGNTFIPTNYAPSGTIFNPDNV